MRRKTYWEWAYKHPKQALVLETMIIASTIIFTVLSVLYMEKYYG